MLDLAFGSRQALLRSNGKLAHKFDLDTVGHDEVVVISYRSGNTQARIRVDTCPPQAASRHQATRPSLSEVAGMRTSFNTRAVLPAIEEVRFDGLGF